MPKVKEVQSTIVFRADPEAERRLIETVKSWTRWHRIFRPGDEWRENPFKGDDDFRDAVHEVICACLQERWEDVEETWHSVNTARSREVRTNAPLPTVRPPGKGRVSRWRARKPQQPAEPTNGAPIIPFRK